MRWEILMLLAMVILGFYLLWLARKQAADLNLLNKKK